jgi:hypothetical protein
MLIQMPVQQQHYWQRKTTILCVITTTNTNPIVENSAKLTLLRRDLLSDRTIETQCVRDAVALHQIWSQVKIINWLCLRLFVNYC